MRRSQVYSKNGRPKPAFFRDKSGTSCDLELLTTKDRLLSGRPEGSGIVQFSVEDVREASDQMADVLHKPLQANYGHCEIHPGDMRALNASAELELSKRAKFILDPDIKRLDR